MYTVIMKLFTFVFVVSFLFGAFVQPDYFGVYPFTD